MTKKQTTAQRIDRLEHVIGVMAESLARQGVLLLNIAQAAQDPDHALETASLIDLNGQAMSARPAPIIDPGGHPLRKVN